MSEPTRGLWCGPADCGTTASQVAEFVAKVADSGFNLLLPELKGGNGRLRWPSRNFPQAVEKPYDEFDLPAVLLEECKRRGVELHCWLIDFYDSGPAFTEHPEWAARDAHGRATNQETLRGKQYTGVWMCPALRPNSYVWNWLLPIYQEFAESYAFDAVHHDYVRYGGDLAPDQYCFCDHCLNRIPAWAGYVNPAFPDEPFDHALYDRHYLESHWEQSPRVLPTFWSRLQRHEKARFLLEGSFFRYGRHDLDYFFYQYRKEQIRSFVEMAHERVIKARPGMGVSAAVFKNPVHSGRFIGQDWREWRGRVDTMIPMDYRDHFPGTFDHYLGLLGDAIERQLDWAAPFKRYLTGFAVWPLIREGEREENRASHLRDVMQVVSKANPAGLCLFCAGDLTKYGLWETAARAFASA